MKFKVWVQASNGKEATNYVVANSVGDAANRVIRIAQNRTCKVYLPNGKIDPLGWGVEGSYKIKISKVEAFPWLVKEKLMKKFKRVGTYKDGSAYTRYYLAETAAHVVEVSLTAPIDYKGSVKGFDEEGYKYAGWFSDLRTGDKIEVTAIDSFPFDGSKKQSILKKIKELEEEAQKL